LIRKCELGNEKLLLFGLLYGYENKEKFEGLKDFQNLNKREVGNFA